MSFFFFFFLSIQDYGLFKLIDGDESQLADNDLPQVIKAELTSSGKECRFAYKRIDAKFVWPILN